MPQYLAAMQHPKTFEPPHESPETIRDIDALNAEMEAAGVRFYAGGVESPTTQNHSGKTRMVTPPSRMARSSKPRNTSAASGSSLDESLEWGKKAGVAGRTPVEIRAFLEMPSE